MGAEIKSGIHSKNIFRKAEQLHIENAMKKYW